MSKDILFTLPEKLDPRWTALLVVDYQNDFVAEGGVFQRIGTDVRSLRAIAPRLGWFINEVRQREIPVIYIKCVYNAVDGRYLSDVFLSQAKRTLRGAYIEMPLCVEGTWGCDFYEEVKPTSEDIVVVKHRFGAFIDTDLHLILRSKGIRTLIVTGVTTNCCVESTVRHAFFYDFYNVVVRDCVAAYDPELHRAALKNMDLLFGQVANSEEVLDALDSHRSLTSPGASYGGRVDLESKREGGP